MLAVETARFAQELNRFCADYRSDPALERALEFVRGTGADDEPDFRTRFARARAMLGNRDIALVQGLARETLPMLADIAAETDRLLHQFSASYEPASRVLNALALLLPAAERARFVAEALGNLADCDHWGQRVDHLVCLVLSMPRLARMMRRDGRRGRL